MKPCNPQKYVSGGSWHCCDSDDYISVTAMTADSAVTVVKTDVALHTYMWCLAARRAWDTGILLGKASRPRQIDRGKCGGWSVFIFFVNQSITFLQKVCETLQSPKICLSVSSCSLQKEQSLFDEIPILYRKSFVAILRWSSLNWNWNS